MWPNLQFPADLVTSTEEILNGKLHFLCSVGTTNNDSDCKKAPSPTPSTQRNYAISKICNLLLHFQPLKLIKKHPLYQLKTFFQWKTTLKSFQYLRQRKIDHIDHKLIEDPAKICKPCVPAHSILLISVPRCLKK